MSNGTSVGRVYFDLGVNADGLNNAINAAANNIRGQLTASFRTAFQGCEGQLANLGNIMTQFSGTMQGSMGQLSQSLVPLLANLANAGDSADDFGDSVDGVGDSADDASNSTSSLSLSLKKLGSMIISVFAVTKIVQFSKACVEAAAEVKAATSQFEQSFGDLAASADSAIQSVAQSSGILETRLQGVGTSIYAFAKTTGMDSTQALNMMQEALQVTADSAAYYDRSLEDTAESLKSFLKGNFENDAALGLSCTETTRNAAANKLYGKSFIELSESQKQLTLLQMVKDANKLSGAMGQAARESDGWENVIGNLKEAWKQFQAVIGKPLLQALIPIIKNITSAIQSLTTAASKATKTLADLFGWDLGEVENTGGAITDIAESTTDSVSEAEEQAQDDIENTVKAQKKAQKQLAGFDNLNVLSQPDDEDEDTNSPEELPVTADEVGNVSSAVEDLQNSINSVNCSVFDTLADKVKKALEPFQPLADAVKGNLQTTVETAQKSVDKYMQKYSGTVSEYGGRIKESIKNTVTQTSNGVANILNEANESQKRNQDKLSAGCADMLGGASVFSLSFADVFAGMFDTTSKNFEQWTIDNSDLIGGFFDGIYGNIANFSSTIGGIFEEIGTKLTDWWDNSGSQAFDNLTQAFFDVQSVVLDFWNNYISPFIDYVINSAQELWDNHLAPLWDGLLEFISSLWDCIAALWNNLLRPLYDTFIKRIMVGVMGAVKSVWDMISDAVGAIIDIIKGIIRSLQGVLDFITGIFTGDMEKAVKGFAEFVQGICQAIWGAIKGVINIIIDALNTVWSAIYGVLKSIVDGVGDFVGMIGDLFGKEWGFSMPDEVPRIPRLAKGGLVTAPTLAIVGDNKNAKSDPEVVSPLSKLQGMIDNGSSEDTEILRQILMYLKMLYEFYENGGGDININAELNGDVVFKDMVKRNKAYSRRNGKGAFAR